MPVVCKLDQSLVSVVFKFNESLVPPAPKCDESLAPMASKFNECLVPVASKFVKSLVPVASKFDESLASVASNFFKKSLVPVTTSIRLSPAEGVRTPSVFDEGNYPVDKYELLSQKSLSRHHLRKVQNLQNKLNI